jgi:hypothetical protein
MDSPDIHETSITIRQALIIRPNCYRCLMDVRTVHQDRMPKYILGADIGCSSFLDFWHAILMDSPDIHETSITIRQALIIRLGWPPGSPRREREASRVG